MTQEVLIPKMKRIDKKQNRLKVPFLDILLVTAALLLIVGSTFIGFDLKHYILPAGFWSGKNLMPEDFVKTFYIIPQIPVLMFICSVLGKKLAAVTVLLYLLLGLFAFPFFALGGGLTYVTSYGFGYLLSYLPAVIIAASFLNRKYSFMNMFLASLCGVLIIHLFGILYMVLISVLKHDGSTFVSNWIAYQSGLKVIYDFVLSYVLILIGKYIHSGIKFLTD